jgi:hypothetical protein
MSEEEMEKFIIASEGKIQKFIFVFKPNEQLEGSASEASRFLFLHLFRASKYAASPQL